MTQIEVDTQLIIAQCKHRKLHLKDLAPLLDLHYYTLLRWLKQPQLITVSNLGKIADVLHLQWWQLIRSVDPDSDTPV